ncbi:MAG TPA: hypothetical protein DCX43_01265 [Psychrobacter sp.]|nr:hypothetical protein [Psychrobacter sp.]
MIPAAIGLLLLFNNIVGVYGFVVSGLITMLLLLVLATSPQQKKSMSFIPMLIVNILLIAYLVWFIISQGDKFIF